MFENMIKFLVGSSSMSMTLYIFYLVIGSIFSESEVLGLDSPFFNITHYCPCGLHECCFTTEHTELLLFIYILGMSITIVSIIGFILFLYKLIAIFKSCSYHDGDLFYINYYIYIFSMFIPIFCFLLFCVSIVFGNMTLNYVERINILKYHIMCFKPMCDKYVLDKLHIMHFIGVPAILWFYSAFMMGVFIIWGIRKIIIGIT